MTNSSLSAQCLVLCVNYKSTQETIGYIKEIRRQRLDDRVTVVVVDNSPERDELLEAYISEIEKVWLVRPEGNVGYFGGAHWGLTWYLSTYALPEWVIVSNIDIAFAGDRFFETMFALERDADTAVIAPSIRTIVDGRDQNPFLRRRPTRSSWVIRRALFSNGMTYWLWRRINRWRYAHRAKVASLRSETDPPREAEIYAPHGAFVIFHRDYFDRGGSIKHPLKLYGEEIFVAENARSRGLEVRYEPRLRVIHEEHVSTGSMAGKASVLQSSVSFILETYY